VCSCRENFAIWFDSCVPLAHPRVPCTKKHDCHKTLGIKSMCTKKNQCACKAFHHLHMGQCVKNRDLLDTCDHDHQCYCGADCQDKIACIHNNCSCKAGHSPYKSRRCISDQPVVLTVVDQQMRADPKQEETLQSTATELLVLNGTEPQEVMVPSDGARNYVISCYYVPCTILTVVVQLQLQRIFYLCFK